MLNFYREEDISIIKKIKVKNQLYHIDLDDSNYCLTVT